MDITVNDIRHPKAEALASFLHLSIINQEDRIDALICDMFGQPYTIESAPLYVREWVVQQLQGSLCAMQLLHTLTDSASADQGMLPALAEQQRADLALWSSTLS
mgnify:FL=1